MPAPPACILNQITSDLGIPIPLNRAMLLELESGILVVLHRSHTAIFRVLAALSGAITQAEQIDEVQRPSN
jgi:hypothetical protein